MWNVPVMRPKLPVAERLMEYLRRIDRSRSYSNFGPLACALKERLAQHYGVVADNVTTVANATQGLALAAQPVHPGSLYSLPARTFVAPAHAAVIAGLVPYFLDVDADNWAPEPATTIRANQTRTRQHE